MQKNKRTKTHKEMIAKMGPTGISPMLSVVLTMVTNAKIVRQTSATTELAHTPIHIVVPITVIDVAMFLAVRQSNQAVPTNTVVRHTLAKPTNATTEPARRATPIAATTTAIVANTFTVAPA